MSDVDEGVARLESVLGGTRQNAERALRELHALMRRDVRMAERRAERAERRVQDLRAKLRRARRRARKAEAALANGPRVGSGGPVAVVRGLARRVRDRVSPGASGRRPS